MYHKNNFIDEVEKYHPHGKVDENMQTPRPVAIEGLINEVKPKSVIVTHHASQARMEVYLLIRRKVRYLFYVRCGVRNEITKVLIKREDSPKRRTHSDIIKLALKLEGQFIYKNSAPHLLRPKVESIHEMFTLKLTVALMAQGLTLVNMRLSFTQVIKLDLVKSNGRKASAYLHFDKTRKLTKVVSSDLTPDEIGIVRYSALSACIE